MSRTRYSPPQPKSVTLAGVMLILLGTAGVIFYQTEAIGPFKFPRIFAKQQSETASSNKRSCQVLTVYDGDTLACDLNQNKQVDKPIEEIRLLGIDTPEMHYSKKNRSHHTSHETDEPFAKKASLLLTQKADKQTVYLTFDENRFDKYGRTLAYVSLTPKDEAGLCHLMLESGYAKTLFIPPNFRHVKDFKAIERQAKKKRLGIWSLAR